MFINNIYYSDEPVLDASFLNDLIEKFEYLRIFPATIFVALF